MMEASGYLCVDQYLEELVDAKAIQLVLDTGMLSDMFEGMSDADVYQHYEDRIQQLPTVLQLLLHNSVIEIKDNVFQLTEGFKTALLYEDLIKEKIRFSCLIHADFNEIGELFFSDMLTFMRESRTFSIFDYDRALELNPENYEATLEWVKYTTMLSRYESGVFLECVDLLDKKQMLDIGGNSGEFCLNICRQYPQLEASVVDLPVVCKIGEDHVAEYMESDRIEFLPLDMRTDELPQGNDLVSFKSVLHDWPENYVPGFIEKAIDSMIPGGTLLIFERVTTAFDKNHLKFSMLPIFVFNHFYRTVDYYRNIIEDLGMVDIEVQLIELDMPFMLLSANKPA